MIRTHKRLALIKKFSHLIEFFIFFYFLLFIYTHAQLTELKYKKLITSQTICAIEIDKKCVRCNSADEW